jgi:hypothetical protein
MAPITGPVIADGIDKFKEAMIIPSITTVLPTGFFSKSETTLFS